jgi:CRP/FNR family cyclic AMP-dependent transcriptional regulator
MTQAIIPRDFSPLASGLAEQGTRRHYRKGNLLLQEGNVANTIFMVLAGSLRVFSQDVIWNREYTHDICGPGRIVGVVGFDGGLCEASVVTLEATTCSVVGYPGLTEYLAAHPNFALELLADALGDVRKARQRATTLALWDVYRRLAGFLTDQASTGALLKISHQAIADQIGASREMVSRLMRDLELGGYIEKAGRSLLVKKAFPSSW